MNQPLHFITIAEAAGLMARRELSPVEYLEALITRIEALEPQVNAFVHRMFEGARAQAAEAEGGIVSV
jgi:Asp-tRNA(Asn)/Glu-tRNA(Gln) amidotransferase A subunit family amidase